MRECLLPGQAAEAGPLSDTAHFAEFEAHTRGVGSRLLARWGYVAGRGLGAHGQGMPAPLEVRAPKLLAASALPSVPLHHFSPAADARCERSCVEDCTEEWCTVAVQCAFV